MNKTQLYRLVFGILCFVWIGIKVYELLDPAEVITRTRKIMIYLGIFAFAILGIDNLGTWWKQHFSKKQQQ